MSISRRHISWLYPILVFSICGICFLSFSRLLLVWWKWDRVQASDGLWYVLLQGLRFDVVFIAQLIALPVVLVPFMCLHRTGLRWARRGMLIYFTILAGFLVYMESVTPNFIGQFDFRPSRLFLEYLIYPKEVFTMLIKAVPAQLAAVIIVTAVSAWQFARLLKRCAKSVQPSVFWSAPLLALRGLVVCVVAARSTLGHRPVNPSTVAFSSDPLVNSLPLS
ncbi:MAG: LTA synthase family protein, partial [Gammaproteobacteria bacterium]